MAALLRAAAAGSLVRRLSASAAPLRRLSAAAAFAYDDYDDDDFYRGELPSPARPAPLPAAGDDDRAVQWVFIGSPPAQRRAYATRVAEILGVPYISMGTLVRQELNPRSALYRRIAQSVNERKLVPDDVIFRLLSKKLEEEYLAGETGFVLDGIPRNPIQAEILDQMVDVDLVVNFKSGDCVLMKQQDSDVCSHCGKIYDTTNSASTVVNPCLTNRTRHTHVHSAVAGLEAPRVDKLLAYSEEMKQLEEYYESKRKLLNFNMSAGPGETWRGLVAALELQHLEAAASQLSQLQTRC